MRRKSAVKNPVFQSQPIHNQPASRGFPYVQQTPWPRHSPYTKQHRATGIPIPGGTWKWDPRCWRQCDTLTPETMGQKEMATSLGDVLREKSICISISSLKTCNLIILRPQNFIMRPVRMRKRDLVLDFGKFPELLSESSDFRSCFLVYVSTFGMEIPKVSVVLEPECPS